MEDVVESLKFAPEANLLKRRLGKVLDEIGPGMSNAEVIGVLEMLKHEYIDHGS